MILFLTDIRYRIILCYRVDENLSIKVADFGLARDIYSTEYYKMNQHTTLPVKWMSLESLLDGFFDEKTDMVCDCIASNCVATM